MDLLFEQPVWLWIAIVAIPMLFVGAKYFAAMSPSRRVLAITARGVLVIAIAMLLAGLSSLRRTNTLAVIAVVDTSGSVQRFYRPGTGEPAASTASPPAGRPADAAGAIRAFLDSAAGRRGPEDYVGVVAFDGNAMAVATPGRDRTWDRSWTLTPQAGTNIADAIRLARALVPPDASGRIVLFSDGNQTAGDAVAAANEVVGSGLGRSPARIDVVPLSYALTDEVMVESVDSPPTAPAEATVNVRVVINATKASTGTLYLFNEGQRLDLGPGDGTGRRISLQPGRNVQLVEVDLGPGRVHRFKAVFEPDTVSDGNGGARLSGDNITENNTGESFTITPGKGSVLIVDGNHPGGDPEGTLAQTLRRAGIETSVVSPENMPTGILALQAYDMILLDNVGAFAMNTDAQRQLVAYVRDMGGGLAMVGGPESFGPGGWKGTPVGDILPVLLDLPDRVIAPQTATVMVLDNSGSMRRPVLGSTRSQQQIANESAALAISSMDKSDMVGVVVFNSESRTVIPLEQNTNPAGSVAEVRGIVSGGGTDLAAGLESAIAEFKRLDESGTKVKTRHAIIMTDGKSQHEDQLPGLVQQLVSMDVKVSAIAVGDDADIRMLDKLATAGGGTFYYAQNPSSLPKIFLKAVRIVRSPLIRETPFEPVTLLSGSPITTGLGPSPSLGGLVLTRPRAEPSVVMAMVTPTGEPVLAHWNVGLGQVVAFTSDDATWAANWLPWPGYERMWSQLVRAASRPPGGREVRGSTRTEGDEIVLRLDAVKDDATPMSGLSVPVTIYAPSGAAMETSLAQTAPGVYEGRARAAETGSYIALIKPQMGTRRLQPVIVGTTVQEGSEYRSLTSNDSLLAQIARTGQGRMLDISRPQDAALFSRENIRPAEAVTPLWRLLMICVLGLFLFDVAMRRVAWDRWFSVRFRGTHAQKLLRTEQARAAAAERSIAGLRVAAAQSDGNLRAADGIALSDRDASDLIVAARDRRRAQRMGDISVAGRARQEPPPAGATAAQQPQQDAAQDAVEPSSLLAAKRRAARRFDEE